MSYSGTVRCGHCYSKGHNRSTCEELIKIMKSRLESDSDDWRARAFFERKNKRGKNKKCSYCDQSGHQRRTCLELKHAKKVAIKLCTAWRKKLVEAFKTTGIGIGALVEYKHWDESKLGIISGIQWWKLDHRLELGTGGDACALVVKAVNNLTALRSDATLQIPSYEGLFSRSRYSHAQKSPVIVGPLKAQAIERQIPTDFYSGQSCIEAIFLEDEKPKYRTRHHAITDWCPLQGFYA